MVTDAQAFQEASDKEVIEATRCAGVFEGVASILLANCAMKTSGRAPSIPSTLTAQPPETSLALAGAVSALKRTPEIWDRTPALAFSIVLSKGFPCVGE